MGTPDLEQNDDTNNDTEIAAPVDRLVMQTPLMMAVCCVMPNGDVLWYEAEKGSKYLNKVITAWKEQNPEFKDTECTMGCVEIRMPVDKFYGIQASNTKRDTNAAARLIEQMSAVVEAAKGIRHWHDSGTDWMVVSAEHVRHLWQALDNLDV